VARFISAAFGAVPAMLLAFGSVILGVTGVPIALNFLTTGNPHAIVVGAVVVGWFVLVAWGTYGLWVAALGPDPIRNTTMVSLVGGVIAIAPVLDSLWRWPETVWLAGGPPAVACWHLWRYVRVRVFKSESNTQPDL